MNVNDLYGSRVIEFVCLEILATKLLIFRSCAVIRSQDIFKFSW